MTTRRHKKVGTIAVAIVITLVLGACAGDDAGASQGATKLANRTLTPAATGGAGTEPTETGPTETGPTETGPTETGPTETGPTVAPDTGSEDNSYRIPPEGTAVSTPVEGELIAEAYGGFTGQVRVYADGRVLSAEHNGAIIFERRLSPEGVELVRQVLGERVHLGYGPGAVRLESLLGYSGGIWLGNSGGIWSRQSAWEDREGKPYVPARYWACVRRTDLPLEAVLDLLPASAQALLRGSDPAWNPRCFVVTPEEARSLEAILSKAGSFNGDPWPWAVGAWSLPDGKGDQFGISLRPLFPDGRRFFRVPY